MKLQNRETKSKVVVVNIILLIVFFTSLIFSYLDIKMLKSNDEITCIVSFILLLYMSYLGCPFFLYDSQGETLIIQNKKSIPFAFLVHQTQSDFPKRKLHNFHIQNMALFKKKLEIYIDSKRVSSGVSKITFDISYLSSKEIKDLKISLNKVIKENELYNIAEKKILEKDRII